MLGFLPVGESIQVEAGWSVARGFHTDSQLEIRSPIISTSQLNESLSYP